MTKYEDLLRDAMSGLARPDGLTTAAGVAASVFEAIRTGAEVYVDTDPGLFAALMLTAAEAADGRDALARAGTPRPAALAPGPPLAPDRLAGLARALTGLLAAASGRADDPADAAACERAAACADRIHALLARDGS